MTIIITAFEASPDRGRGLARDMRVRWTLEELGLPYAVRLLSFAAMKEPEHLARHPFGQIPTFEEGDLVLFESGAIVLHLAQTHAGLLPDDSDARARAINWMFAAIGTLEPVVLEREYPMLFERDKPWFAERAAIVEPRLHARLAALSQRLGEGEWLERTFSAGDLMVIEVLKRPACRALLEEYPKLAAYVARGEARPAFQRAFAAQLAVFEANSPP